MQDTLPLEKVGQDLIANLLEESKQNILYFYEALDLQTIQRLFDYLMQTKGTIFLSGVGKSSLVAKKIVATMNASGTKALYLSPMNALHGDVGMVSKGDVVLMLSKSGESDELTQLCPSLRNKGAFLVAVVCNPTSRLAKAADLIVHLPIAKELCPFDMVPTTSTQAQLLFGDLLSIALMRAKGFTIEEFRHNHPAGRLGKRLTITVKDLMLAGNDLPLALPDDLLINVLSDFSGKKCGCLIVVDKAGILQGIFTDGDLRRSLQKHGPQVLHKPLSEIMTATPRALDSQGLAYDAMKFMEADQKHPITVIPVIDEERKVVGVLKMHDIVQSGLT